MTNIVALKDKANITRWELKIYNHTHMGDNIYG